VGVFFLKHGVILIVTNHISGTAEARVVKFCIQVEYIKCSYDELPTNGRV